MPTRKFTWCINYESTQMGDSTMEPSASNISSTLSPELMRKEQERIEFYSTYDVMTGVRIAATLGGFFGLMVLLVLVKSKSKTQKALEDPNLAAAAVAVAEEEERQIAAALEANAYEQLNPSRRSRRSLDTAGVTPHWIRNSRRCSSIGGYATPMDVPIRLTSPARLPCAIDEDAPTNGENGICDDVYPCCDRHLGVPHRRPSNVSSSASSYLERRGSDVMLGLPCLPPHKIAQHQISRRRQSSPVPRRYDLYYPIDIRVIQPTPRGSPCGSERTLYDLPAKIEQLQPRLAPLASISSCSSSMANDYPDLEMQSHASYASDSVFRDIEHDDDGDDDDEGPGDTDDEVDPFSSDSDEDRCGVEAEGALRTRACCSQQECHRLSVAGTPLSAISDESTERAIKLPQDKGQRAEMLKDESRTSRTSRSSAFECDLDGLGALGVTLETLERGRNGSMEASPTTSSLTSSLVNQRLSDSNSNVTATAPEPQEQEEATEESLLAAEQGVWSKETLF